MADNDEGQQDQGTEPQQPDGGQQDDGATPEPKQDTTDWRAQARKWEQRAKENSAAAKKLADLEAANQTAQEKAEAAAKAAEERAAAAEKRAASALIHSTLVGSGYTPDHASALIEDMNVSRYIGDGGDVDTEAVKAKYAPLAPASGPRAPAPNPAQGQGGKPKSLGELIAEAEKASTGSRQDTNAIMRLKARQLVEQNKG